jgi:hypothetical protein
MATMTIQTASASAANRLQRLNGALGAPLLALALCIPISLRQGRGRRMAWLGIVLAITGMQGCGGGFALPQQTTSPTTQTFTVTVIGTSGAIQHSTTVQIAIQS